MTTVTKNPLLNFGVEVVKIFGTALLNKSAEISLEKGRDCLEEDGGTTVVKFQKAVQIAGTLQIAGPVQIAGPLQVEVAPVELKLQPLATGCAIGTVCGVVGTCILIQALKALSGGKRGGSGNNGED